MAEPKLYWCQGCEDDKPESAFEFYIDKNDRRAPRKNCRVCNGSEGHKVCAECRVDKPIDKFKAERKPGRLFEISYNRSCWACIYARRKSVGTTNYRTKKERQRYGKRNPEFAPRRNSRGQLPVGWTPPPTLEQLGEIHRQYKPPPGWTTPLDEQLPDTG